MNELRNWTIAPDVVWVDNPDEVRLYDGATGRFQTFNATAALVWRGLMAGQDLDALFAGLLDTYQPADPADAARICADVTDFVADLEQRGLITPGHADAPAS